MMDSEFYTAPEHWPQPPDEDCTLQATSHPAIIPKKVKKKSSARRKRKLSESLAGITVAAVVVATLAGALPEDFLGPSWTDICPICSDETCPYYSEGKYGLNLVMEMAGEPEFVHMSNLGNMPGFSYEDDEGRQYIGSINLYGDVYNDASGASASETTDTVIDSSNSYVGSRLVFILESEYCQQFPGETVTHYLRYNPDLQLAPDPGIVGLLEEFCDEKSGDTHYFFIGLVYSTDGTVPDQVPAIVMEKYPEYDFSNASVEVITVNHTPNAYILAATNLGPSVAKDLIGYGTVLPDDPPQNNVILGSTMRLQETARYYRTYEDRFGYGFRTNYNFNTDPLGDEETHFLTTSFAQKRYRIDSLTGDAVDICFVSTSWHDIFARWQQLNEDAPSHGHTVDFPLVKLDPVSVNGITYDYYFAYQAEPGHSRNYRCLHYYVPRQESNMAFLYQSTNISQQSLDKILANNTAGNDLAELLLPNVTLN